MKEMWGYLWASGICITMAFIGFILGHFYTVFVLVNVPIGQ